MNYTKAKVIFYSPDRGGRPFVPIRDGYAPYLKPLDSDDMFAVRINGMPINGKYNYNYEVEIELTYHPKIDYSILIKKKSFVMIEGPKFIGEGFILSEIYCQDCKKQTCEM